MIQYYMIFALQGIFDNTWRRHIIRKRDKLKMTVIAPFVFFFVMFSFSLSAPSNVRGQGTLYFYPLY